ncbi:hypothetical protein V8E54_013197 [Elaphomyces granulatus]
MAVNAVSSQLGNQVLVFSVSHGKEGMKIYDHHAAVEGAKETFYRYPIESFNLNFRDGQGRKRMYDFVREVYQKFHLEHLKRIQGALAKMDDPRAQSITSSMSLGDGRYH